MHLSIVPAEVTVTPGTPVVLTVAVTNTDDIIGGYEVQVLGVDSRWVTRSDPSLSLFPGVTGTCVITLSLPTTLLAGQRRITVRVREITGKRAAELHHVLVDVPEAQSVELRMEPSSVTAGKRADFAMVVTNTGNAPVAAHVQAADEEAKVRFRFVPETVTLAAGERALVEISARARRRLVGQLVVRPLSFSLHGLPSQSATQPAAPVPLAQAPGILLQRPVLGRAALSLLGLLAAITVFALVITLALSRVVGQSAADRDLALRVAAAAQQGDATGTASVRGTVRLRTTQATVPGVTVDLVAASDPASVVASAPTRTGGTYVLSNVKEGRYKLRFRGAGFNELWFPDAPTEADAQVVVVKVGDDALRRDVRLDGLSASIAGTVTGVDPTGAVVSLLAPGTTASTTSGGTVSSSNSPPAVFHSVKVSNSGEFVLTSVVPSTYDLQVTKQGFATQVLPSLTVGNGEQRTGVTLELLKGDGLLGGIVRDVKGALAEATVSVQYGTTTLQTASLPGGRFTLSGLPTPQTVTLSVAAPAHATQVLSLSLAAGQQLTGLDITLGNSAGTLTGTVRAAGTPATGVTVLVTDGALTLQTVTASSEGATKRGAAGSWTLGGLPAPGTYTVTFSRDDLVSQTLSVSLDASGQALGDAASNDLPVDLLSATLDLSGKVTFRNLSSGDPAPPVTVTLASTTSTYTIKAATGPTGDVGRWFLGRVKPGTYTLTATARGSRPTSRVVHYQQGAPSKLTENLLLDAPASITVTVKSATDAPVKGARVRVFLAAAYPDQELASGETDAHGTVTFRGLDAPQRYVVDYSLPGAAPQQSSTFELTLSDPKMIPFGGSG
jgi:type II secretory pathway pseudopilin PulG